MDEEVVVLVDAEDKVIGEAAKLRAHREGLLHRAISVFLFNAAGEVLLQRRSSGKYHSAGLWSNTCCTHPRVGEAPLDAATRRLEEEMGMRCALEPGFSFIYRAELDGGLIEHELDHVFTGTTASIPRPNAAEVEGWRWIDPSALRDELEADPSRFTAWFPLVLDRVIEHRPGTAGPPPGH